jgi:hypothetical protein
VDESREEPVHEPESEQVSDLLPLMEGRSAIKEEVSRRKVVQRGL